MKRLAPWIVAWGCVLFAGAQTAPPAAKSASLTPALTAILRHAPADTHLLIVVPDLDALTSGVAAFAHAAGINELRDFDTETVLAGPLGPSWEAVDRKAPAVLVISAERDEPLVYVVLRDVEQWRATSRPAAEEDSRILELPDDRVAALVGERIAVFGRDRAVLRRALESDGEFLADLPAELRSRLATRHCVVWANVRAWQTHLQQSLAFVAQTMYMGMAAAGPDAELAVQFYRTLFDRIDKLVAEADSFVVGLQVSGERVVLDQRVAFRPDGVVGGYLSKIEKSNADMFRGVRAGAALAFACEWSVPPDVPTVNGVFSEAFMQMASLKEKMGADKLRAAVENNEAMNRLLRGVSGGMRRAESGEGLVFSGQYLTSEPAKLRELLGKGFEQFPDMMKACGMGPSAEVGHETRTIGDVQADVFGFTFHSDDPAVDPILTALYGREARMVFAPRGSDVVYALGPGQTALDECAAVIEGKTPLTDDPQFKAALAQLSPQPQACAVLDLPRLAGVISALLQTMGLPIPPVSPATGDVPMVAVALYLDPAALRVEAVVPARAIRIVVDEFAGSNPGGGEPY